MPHCIVCNAELLPALKLDTETAATSDCHAVAERIQIFRCLQCSTLQKVPDPAYLAAIRRIYDSYSIYHLSAGHEQLKFLDGVPRTRSDIILDYVANQIPMSGDLLDVGTGSGVFLRAAHRRYGSKFDLYGHDITPHAGNLHGDLPVKKFYFGELPSIGRRFDMISMIHVLEHVTRPLETLAAVRNLLKKDGVLLVQVPNVQENVFDTVVFDHVFHFTKDTVIALLERCGFECAAAEKQLNNEITILARSGKQPRRAFGGPAVVVDLTMVNAVTDYLVANREPIGMFGVAPTGTYCGALLRDYLTCFVDEDESIHFKKHLGKPILPPDHVVPESKVFLPPNKNARLIQKRLTNLHFISLDETSPARVSLRARRRKH